MTEMKEKHQPIEAIDEDRRRFLLKTTGLVGGLGALCALTPFAVSLLPSSKTAAKAGPVEVDIGHLNPGEQMTVAWRGQPVWIIRRTAEEIKALNQPNPYLRDPNSLAEQQPDYAKNDYRSVNPEYLVLIGICTHLGCTPKYKPSMDNLGKNWPGGFICPCHGSRFDLAGRVYKSMPAPLNLEVPPYRFINEKLILIGDEAD